ncbi:unnamed protein product [Notodromas monacha]|uniref:TGF-beta family profile domain-containing protein n=1 Tax=Notodromas monacha TaxID=399045 RepID=A0A7R9BMY8_9CRUS|nr:unnamed protein product [Notodromas monacha]CAG0918477.1 unnamed protein product [Notodromas monacha]
MVICKLVLVPEEKMSASTENLNVQYFSFSKLLMKYSISDARLWIYMKADRSAEEIFDHLDTERPSRRRIPVYKVPKPPAGYEFRSESPILTQVGNVTKPYYKNNWVSLDVRSLVQDWFKDPTTNYGIIIGGPGESDSSFVVARAANVTSTHGHEEGNVPYLEIQVSEHNRRTRTKRNVGLDCDDSLRNKNLCCRHPLVVDFETIGWDWIIAPRSYHAFHCAGYCEPLHMPEYHHTIIVGQKLIVDTDINGYDPRSIYGNRPPPVACCAPKKLSALSLLHFTPDSEIIVSKVPEMITDSCTCA